MFETPLKRMALLERRKQDDRAFFSRHWRVVHGQMVSRLPRLAAYLQNHVVEEFSHDQNGFPGDGFVEQLWRSTVDMQVGYSSPVVKELVADERNYLGHGSNYAILASEALKPAEDSSKLIVAIRHGGSLDFVDSILDNVSKSAGHVIRDDVIATIPKPNMLPVLPHQIDVFLHLYFTNAELASRSAHALVRDLPRLGSGAAIGLWRVRTETIL